MKRATWARASLIFILATLVSMGGSAQEPTQPVCLKKVESTGGHLMFILRPVDAQLFEGVNFAPVACPIDLNKAAAALAKRCARLRNLDDDEKAFVRSLYGLSVEQMCDASDAWTSTQLQD